MFIKVLPYLKFCFSSRVFLGSKINRDGTAFEVSLDPITTPIKKAPARLERLKSKKKRSLTKEKLEIKMKKAQARRVSLFISCGHIGYKLIFFCKVFS